MDEKITFCGKPFCYRYDHRQNFIGIIAMIISGEILFPAGLRRIKILNLFWYHSRPGRGDGQKDIPIRVGEPEICLQINIDTV